MIPQPALNIFKMLMGIIFLSLGLIGCDSGKAGIETAEANAMGSQPDSSGTAEPQATSKVYTHPYLTKADEIRDEEGAEIALPYYEAAVSLFEKEGNWEGYITALNRISSYYLDERSYDNALISLNKSLTAGQSQLDSTNLVLSETNFLMGRYYEEINEPFNSLEHHKKALNNRMKVLGLNSIKVAESFNGIGDIYLYVLSDYPEALNHYNQSLKIREKLSDTANLNIMLNYYRIYSCYRNLGDFDNAEIYVKEAISICEKLPGDNTIRLATLNNGLGNIFFDKKEYTSAIRYYEIAIKMVKDNFGNQHVRLGSYYNNIGSVYKSLGDHLISVNDSSQAKLVYQKAKSFQRKGLNINKLNNNQLSESYSYYNLGWIYSAENNIDSALHFYNLCLDFRVKHFGLSSKLTVDVYEELGLLYKNIDSLTNSLEYLQKALITLIDGFNSKNIHDNPLITEDNHQPRLYEIMITKAEVLRKLYDHSNDLKYLQSALDSYEVIEQVTDIARRSYQHENTKLFWIETGQSHLQNAIETAYILSEKTKSPEYMEAFFKFIEKGKYIMLFESLHQAEKFGSINVPDSIYEIENSLKSKFAFFQHKKSIEESKADPDLKQIASYNSALFDINRQQNQAREMAIEHFPEYFQIKYDSLSLKLFELQEILGNEQAQVIEYYWADKYLYAINVKKGAVSHLKVPITDSLIRNLDNYQRIIVENKEFTNPDNFKTYTQSAFNLYKWLIKPLIDSTKISGQNLNSLIIIPDGKLSVIPFGSLLTEPVSGGKIDYKNLPYMIRGHKISYSYSANLFFKERGASNKNKNPKILALSYSPTFNSSKDSNIKDEILGTADEITKIRSSTSNGEFFMGNQATEHNFKSKAPDYDILHLAIHGQADDSLLNTRLIFKNNLDTLEDGLLYDFELYNLKLKAKLVVLSACETALGKQFKGEGIYSIARGFAYAGCPSIIMSYWKANDRATAQVMNYFYQELTDGKAINQSLRSAKLAYLDQADEFSAHPATWAAFVPLGDVSKPVYPKNNKSKYFYLFILGLLSISILLFIYGRYIKNRLNALPFFFLFTKN